MIRHVNIILELMHTDEIERVCSQSESVMRLNHKELKYRRVQRRYIDPLSFERV
jgi:hypothetical protein